MASVTIYMPVGSVAQAHADLAPLGSGWDKTFTVGRSATGNEPATYRIANFGNMSADYIPGLMNVYGATTTEELIANVEARYTGCMVFVDVPVKDSEIEMGLKTIDIEG